MPGTSVESYLANELAEFLRLCEMAGVKDISWTQDNEEVFLWAGYVNYVLARITGRYARSAF